MNKADIKAAFIFKISVLNSAINITLESTLEISTINSNLEKLYIICVASKSTKIIKQEKSIISKSKKLKKIHIDL